MTKKVRIENADTSDHKVVIQTWNEGQNGEEDIMIKEERADYPTAMIEGLIFKEQYLVIIEA